MSHPHPPHLILCNGASPPKGTRKAYAQKAIRLEYRKSVASEPNVRIHLPEFVRDVYHLPPRMLDLLEIAAYAFAGDRSVQRGEKDALELHSWSRSMHFAIKVRDVEFWNREVVKTRLSEALCFTSGDRKYEFTFEKGHSTPVTSLFDASGVTLPPSPDAHVAMFSGGLDSLAGIIQHLKNTATPVILISHQSGQTGTHRTQNQLFDALNRLYPNRIRHYKFGCGLSGDRAEEETQRTRAFLYTSIGFVLARAVGTNRLMAYENGVTAINFIRRSDLLNARASRTTHPKTIYLMNRFFAAFEEDNFHVDTPFVWKTKADIFHLLSEQGGNDLITSSVSCSKTFRRSGVATHCGGCSQCIDRRFAAYASGVNDVDDGGIYTIDFLTQCIEDQSVRTTLVDFVRQARQFAATNVDEFQKEKLTELTDVIGYIDGVSEEQAVEQVYTLCSRHGRQVRDALRRMRDIHDDPFRSVPAGSLLSIIGDRDYLKQPPCDSRTLLRELSEIPTGRADAHRYEGLASTAITAVFHPDLTNPRTQQPMDNGRKRIDITFDNMAQSGFFARLQNGHKKVCPYIIVECKNYSEDVANPEFAQLADRLSDRHAEVGFILCRSISNRAETLKQCQDRYDRRGIFIIVLDDADLTQLLGLRERHDLDGVADYLEEKVREIVMRV